MSLRDFFYGLFRALGGYATVPPAPVVNPLEGKKLRYMIGYHKPFIGADNLATVVAYDVNVPPLYGIGIGYCNAFDEYNTGNYGPYLEPDDVALEYDEGMIDPTGTGWEKNLYRQFMQRKAQGFEFVEIDNLNSYPWKHAKTAVDLAASMGLKVIAKNPLGCDWMDAVAYIEHPSVYGIIVERGGGEPRAFDALRWEAGKPTLPVWFVAFGLGRRWADTMAELAEPYPNMSVTYSSVGEYSSAQDVS